MNSLNMLTMKNKIPIDFSIHKYGVDVRLVVESDAQFIVDLRTNWNHTDFLEKTSPDVRKQIDWIREYKKREIVGIDYYFIYSYKGKPYGVNRVYDISDNECTGGSWVCKSRTDAALVIISNIIEREIIFDYLGYSYTKFEVNKDNKKIIKYHKLLGATIVGENDIEYNFVITKDVFEIKKRKILFALGLTEE